LVDAGATLEARGTDVLMVACLECGHPAEPGDVLCTACKALPASVDLVVPDEEMSRNGHRRTSWTATELLAETFPDPRFAVVDLIPEGLTFLAGAPKLGKSWLALGLGVAVAAGGRALGKIPVESGPVLYLALEDSPRRLQSRLLTLLGPDAGPEGLHLETEWPRLDAGGLERIDEWLEANPAARLGWIDVWPRIRARTDRRTDHYQADYEAAAQLQAAGRRSSCRCPAPALHRRRDRLAWQQSHNRPKVGGCWDRKTLSGRPAPGLRSNRPIDGQGKETL
jgi:AAA domain-containing protein